VTSFEELIESYQPASAGSLTQARLQEVVHCDPITGMFTRKLPTLRRKVGAIAGNINNTGRWVVRVDEKLYLASRLAWLYMTGNWPTYQIDHKDRNPANDKWENLREANSSLNTMNRGLQSNNSSGYPGVSKFKDKWEAYIKKDGKKRFLGYFTTAEEAAAARAIAAQSLFGEFVPLITDKPPVHTYQEELSPSDFLPD
jgi:hypothetical protein